MLAERPTSGTMIWDPLLRIFHWSLVVVFTTSFILGKFGPADMALHFISGYLMAGLITFRWVWGLIGPQTARFSSFLRGPSAIIGYARHLGERRPSGTIGHNPLGALFVIAILVLLSLQVVTGLLADPEDYLNVGPLAGYVSTDISRKALSLHHTLTPILLALVAVHIAAIAFYKIWKREDLVRPMLTGQREE
jgi:cytochrome b